MGDREVVPHEALSSRDGRVHADHLADQIDERATRVARIDRRVGLDEVLE